MISFPEYSHEESESGSDFEKEDLKKLSDSSDDENSDSTDSGTLPQCVYQCKHCDKTYKAKNTLVRHIIAKHSNERQEIKTKPRPMKSKYFFLFYSNQYDKINMPLLLSFLLGNEHEQNEIQIDSDDDIPDLDEADVNLDTISNAQNPIRNNDKNNKDDETSLWFEPITELLINQGYLIGKFQIFQKFIQNSSCFLLPLCCHFVTTF